jgi:hypothetical protein
MTSTANLMAARMWNERLAGSTLRRPEDVVAWLGAVQSQDYAGARWALAQRLDAPVTDDIIEKAFDEGRILRTHVLRPTWHFVAPADIRWLLQLTAPRVHRQNGFPYRTNGLGPKELVRGASVIVKALEGGRHLTRQELAVTLARARIPVLGQQLAYVVMYAELEGLICSGPRRGKQFTYALVEERVPKSPVLAGDEALAELVRRYFTSHGPATVRDFHWWSGLTMAQARNGIAALGSRLEHREMGGTVCYFAPGAGGARGKVPRVLLLPNYDEFLVAFKDRDWWPARAGGAAVATGLPHHLVIDGRVEGSWTRKAGSSAVAVEVAPYGRLSKWQTAGVHAAVAQYGAFLKRPVSLSIRG